MPSLAAGGVKQITFLHIIPLLGARAIPCISAIAISSRNLGKLIEISSPALQAKSYEEAGIPSFTSRLPKAKS